MQRHGFFGKGLFTIRVMLTALLSAQAFAQALAQDTETDLPQPTITDSPRITFDPRSELPETFALKTRILDDEGTPVFGASVTIEGKEVAKSDKQGFAELEDAVTPSTYIRVEHSRFAPRNVVASDLYSAAGAALPILLTPYTSIFELTPEGGIYQSGQVTLEVPAGAVEKNVRVVAALIPLDHAYNNDGNVESLRLSAIDLKPHGLKFRKPVTVVMTIAREDVDTVEEPTAFYYDETQQRHVRDETSEIKVVGHRISMTLNHLSSHSTADGKKGQTVKEIGRGHDVDGDGKVTPSDAFFMALASGGTHKIDANYNVVATGSVMREHGFTSSSSTTNSASASSGFGVKGFSVNVSAAMSKTQARKIAGKFSKSTGWSNSDGAGIKIDVPEYEFDCDMILGDYIFYRAVEYVRHTPGSFEMNAIKRHWESQVRNHTHGYFEFFDYENPSKEFAGRTFRKKTKIAVTEGPDGLEVYVKKSAYIIAKLNNLTTEPCSAGTGSSLGESVSKAIGGAKGQDARKRAIQNRFRFGDSPKEPKGKDPWGVTGDSKIAVYINEECGDYEIGHWYYSVSFEEVEQDAESDEESDTKSAEVGAGAGGAKVKVSRAVVDKWTSTSTQTTKNGKTANISVNWEIVNAHMIHYSDHIAAELYKTTANGKLPFGFALIRIAERPCGSQTTRSPTPGSKPPRPTQPTAPKPGPAGPTGPKGPKMPGGGPTTTEPHRPDAGPTEPTMPNQPETTPDESEPPIDVPPDAEVPEGESTQEPGDPPDERTKEEMARQEAEESYKRQLAETGLQFADLSGTTNVDGSKIGSPVSAKAFDENGKEIPVEVKKAGDTVSVTVPDGAKPAQIDLVGPEGRLKLRSSFIPPKDLKLPKIKPRPVDGMVDIANGFTKETFVTPEGATDMAGPIEGHSATLGSSSLDIYAVRPNEIGAIGSGVQPSPSGDTWMSLTKPNGDTVAGTVPAWRWDVGAQPATKVNTWAPIYFRCIGLAASDRVSVEFTPTDGQTIESFHKVITCGAASEFVIIAQYMTSRVGPQQFNATVKRLDE